MCESCSHRSALVGLVSSVSALLNHIPNEFGVGDSLATLQGGHHEGYIHAESVDDGKPIKVFILEFSDK